MRTAASLMLLLVALASSGCDGSRDSLLADLQSTRPEERAIAVRKLAQQGKPDDLVLFTRAAKDLNANVRLEAAGALGKSQDPRVVDLLGELLEDSDVDVQARAAMALAGFKTDKSTGYLTLQYGRRARSTRIAIVQALKAANVPGAMARVVAAESNAFWDRNLRALTSGSLPERIAAAEELGKSGRPEAFDRLVVLSRDSQVMLAAAAVRGLGHGGDARAVGPVALLLTENFPELRAAACDALVRLRDPQALVPLLAVALEKSATSPLATQALLALPPDSEVDKALCQITLDGGASEAAVAGREVRKRGGCSDPPVADRLSKARDTAAILQALNAAEALGPTAKAALPKVLPFLNHPEVQVRIRAIAAVAALGDPAALPAVQKLYEQEVKATSVLRAKWIPAELPRVYAPGFDPGKPVAKADPETTERRAKLADLFNRLRSSDVAKAKAKGVPVVETPPPAELIDDANGEQLLLLASAIRVLGTLKAPDALRTLSAHAKDPSALLRTAAYEGLAQLGSEGVAVARAGLWEADREVVGTVARALSAEGEAGQAAILEALPKRSEKLKLLEALRASGAPASASRVLGTLLRGGGPEAVLVAGLLGDMQAKDAVEPLIDYLRDPNTVGRREALMALGRIGDRKAAEIIARDLNHDSPEIRLAAVEALAQVGTHAEVEALDALKGDYYRRVREGAAAALSRISPPPSESKP